MTNGAVWKLNTQTGAWTDITPEHPVPGSKEFGYAAVAVDAHHPQTLIASTFGRPWSEGGDTIFRSTDGGATWKPMFGGARGGVYDYSLAPYVKPTPIHWLFDIEIDPANSDHAVFTTGYGGWETFDLTAVDRGQPTHWSILATGIEETVALQLDSAQRRRASHHRHRRLRRLRSLGSRSSPARRLLGAAALRQHHRRRLRRTSPQRRSSASASAPSTNPATASATRSIPATPGSRPRRFQHRPAAPAPSLSLPMAPRGSGPLSAKLLRHPRPRRNVETRARTPRRNARHRRSARTPRRFLRDFASRIAPCSAAPTRGNLHSRAFQLAKCARPLRPLRAAILAAARIASTPHPAAPAICGSPPSMASITPRSLTVANPTGIISFARLPGVTEIHAFGFGKAAPGRAYPRSTSPEPFAANPASSAPSTKRVRGSASTTTSTSGDSSCKSPATRASTDASMSEPTAAVYSMANLPRAVPAILRGRTHESGTFRSYWSAHSPRTAGHAPYRALRGGFFWRSGTLSLELCPAGHRRDHAVRQHGDQLARGRHGRSLCHSAPVRRRRDRLHALL